MIRLIQTDIEKRCRSRLLPGSSSWLFFILSCTAACHGQDRTLPARRLIAEPRVLVIAHRGASLSAPENTLPAFKRAIQDQADLVELDYYHARDGVPVVFHDKHLDRTTDAIARWGGTEIPVETKTLTELKQLDAGSWFHPKFAGAGIPTLSESLDLIQANSTTLIERKAGDARTCVELLETKNLLDHVVVQAFDWEFLSDCRRQSAKLTLGALGEKELSAERLDSIVATGASVVGWNHQDLSRAAVAAVHARGLRCWAYTVNEAPRARQLIEWQIDGIITDAPAAMRRLVDAGARADRPKN